MVERKEVVTTVTACVLICIQLVLSSFVLPISVQASPISLSLGAGLSNPEVREQLLDKANVDRHDADCKR